MNDILDTAFRQNSNGQRIYTSEEIKAVEGSMLSLPSNETAMWFPMPLQGEVNFEARIDLSQIQITQQYVDALDKYLDQALVDFTGFSQDRCKGFVVALSGGLDSAVLARLLAEMEITERLRKKRLEKEPEGFFLEDRESGYSCNLCSRGLKGSESWWNLDGIQCADCRRSVKEGVIPAEIIKNHDLWIASWQFKSEFGIHSATVSKMKRNGELIGRELKDSEGRTYFTVYMVEDNKKFFKKRKKTSSSNKKWKFVDKDGAEILL